MRCGCRIPDRDALYRHSVHPVAFRGAAFDWVKCLNLISRDNGFEGSLAWERYLPMSDMAHAYGCRLARQRNEQKKASGKFKEKDRQIYAGIYRLEAYDIRALPGADGLDEVLSADVVHQIEKGEIAHASLKVILKPGYDGDPEATKTAVIAVLWNTCTGPLKHVCDYDADVAEHPSERLAAPPSGSFSDQRSQLSRFWALTRFRFLDWMLRTVLRCKGL